MSDRGPLERLSGRARRLVDTRVRAATASQRALPDFVILGAQKAGTTSLYAYLSDHPQVLPAARKEVHYFDLAADRGENWYRGLFPTRAALDRAGALTGEASPYYLFHPLVPARLTALLPEARLIVLLRDPVERAWSHHRHEVAGGREELGFEQALDREDERLASVADRVAAGEVVDLHQTASYVARGRYAEQLRRWFEHVPREQVHVVVAEEMFADPAATYDEVVRFLGLPTGHRPAFEAHNARRDSGLDPRLRARLQATFAGPDAELAELLGRELPWPR